MQQLQPILKQMYQHRFWIICGLVAVLSLATWFFVSQQLAAQTSEGESRITQKQSAINAVLNTKADVGSVDDPNAKVHPNESTRRGMEEKIQEGGQAMLDAWTMLRRRQEPYLVWPGPDVIPPQVAETFRRYDPPELLEDQQEVILDSYRDAYAKFIARRMPQLASIVGGKWLGEAGAADVSPADEQAGGGTLQPGGTPGETVPAESTKATVVIWNEDNQKYWKSKLTQFAGRHGNKTGQLNRPTSAQVLFVQQDLWILEALLDVIKNVNGDAVENDLAPIKVIDHILTGREAMEVKPALDEIRSTEGAAGVTSSLPSFNPLEGLPPGSSLTLPTLVSTAAPGASQTSTSPFDNRYVDASYNLISIDRLRAALTAQQMTEDARLIVARRVPVRVAFFMDERRIPDFLAAAANSPFAFEIHQVRINRHKPNEGGDIGPGGGGSGGPGQDSGPQLQAGDAGGGGGAGLAGTRTEGDGGGPGGAGGGPGMGPGMISLQRNVPIDQRHSFDVQVEFLGIVKLYNPVRPEVVAANNQTP